MQCLVAINVLRVDTTTKNLVDTDSSGMSKIDVVTQIKLTNVMNAHEHLKLIVIQYIMLFGEEKTCVRT